jgi:hypothetical protein
MKVVNHEPSNALISFWPESQLATEKRTHVSHMVEVCTRKENHQIQIHRALKQNIADEKAEFKRTTRRYENKRTATQMMKQKGLPLAVQF